MTQEALKLALEALEEAWYHVGTFQPTEKAIDLYDEARAAIKEALRENAMREVQRLGQEPVAYINVEKRRLEFAEPMVWHTPTVVKLERIPLYTHQRKPLTDEQIEDAWRKVETGDFYDCVQPFARAIEAAHGIKENT